MDIVKLRQVRRETMRAMVKQVSSERVCALITMKRQQLDQYIGPTTRRNIGEKVARRIEQQMNLPHAFIDNEHTPAAIQTTLIGAGILQRDRFEEILARIEKLEELLSSNLLAIEGWRKQNSRPNTTPTTAVAGGGDVHGKSNRTARKKGNG